MEYILGYMADYGFPMIVAVFLLVRMDKRLASLDEGIRHLVRAIEVMKFTELAKFNKEKYK